MEMSYATILVFGDQRRLYRDKQLAYVVNNQNKLENHPMCALDTYVGSSIFYYVVYPKKLDQNYPEIFKQSNYQMTKNE